MLYRTQDLINIASVVRAMKNFGLRDLRLVSPEEYTPHRIEGIAHKTGDLLKRVQVIDDLDQALADCVHVVGLTARQRSAKRNVQRPDEAAHELIVLARERMVAVLLGPEDKGLANKELDRCHRTVTIDTNVKHPSLNLAQAFTIMAYEMFKAGPGPSPFKAPRKLADAASNAQLEELFEDAEQALWAIDFFKTRKPKNIMRTIREIAHRVPIDERETKLLRAMCLEVVRYLDRMGIKR